MTYSYAGPGTNTKDTVRFLIQDVDPHGAQEWFVTDEEIEWAYQTWYPLYHSESYVAAFVAETIAARYAREASYSADGVSISLGPVGDQFRALAASLREQHRSGLVGSAPDVGGMSPYEQLEPDTKPFAFGKGIHDNIEAGVQDLGGVYPPEAAINVIAVPEYEQVVEP